MIKRNDILLILGLIILTAAGMIARSLYFNGSSDYVEIWQDGRLTATYPLGVDREEIFKNGEEDGGGYNIVTIKNGEVCISKADCPDRNCVYKGVVSELNETIICLPHKLVVKLCGNKKGTAPDIVAE